MEAGQPCFLLPCLGGILSDPNIREGKESTIIQHESQQGVPSKELTYPI